jgi:eukaryotic-like serine/threonine-protein kinase
MPAQCFDRKTLPAKKLLATLSALLLSLPIFASDAAMFRGNPQHTGVYDAPGVPQFSRIKWKFHTAGRVVSSPAIAEGTVYVGSTDRNLYAIDLESGAQKWKFATKSEVTSSPAVDAGTVFFGSYDGKFYAVDAGNGRMKWSFQTGGERRYAGSHLHGAQPVAEVMPDPFDYYLSSPAISNGEVYFGSGDGNVYALDETSGSLKWKFQTGDVVHASPAIWERTLFVGSWDSYFYALDANTGKERWRFKTGEDPNIHNQVGIQSSAAVADGVVYFGCRDSNFYALDAHNGLKKWAFNNKGSWVITSPAVKDGRVYFATSDSAMFYVLDARSGATLFSLKLKWPMFSSPALGGNTLYIGTHEGKLLGIDLTAQKIAWTFETDGSKENGPAFTNADGGPKYEAAFASDFYDDMVIGARRMLSVGAILSSPVAVGNIIYVGSSDGNLYALM